MAKGEYADAQATLEALREEGKSLVIRLQAALEEARTTSVQTKSRVEEAVRIRPLTAIALAVAAGFALGSLRRR